MKNCRKNAQKSSNGITLIALVITIIVLLILAGISISMLAGDNSILQKATGAKTNTDNAQIQERINLAYHSALVDGQGEVTEPSLEKELKNEFNKSTLEDGWLDKTSVEGKWKITIDEISLEVPAGKGNDNKVIGTSSDWKLNDAKDTIIAYIGDGVDGDTFVIPNYVDGNKIISIGNGSNPIWSEKFSNPNDFMSGKKLKISDGIKNIKSNAFVSSLGLVGDLTIPDSIVNVENFAFAACMNMNGKLYIGKSVQTIGDNSVFGSCTFNNVEIHAKDIPNAMIMGKASGNLIIGNEVETIGDEAFEGCGFTGEIVIPNNVTNIGENAFYGINKDIITNNSSADGYPWGAE